MVNSSMLGPNIPLILKRYISVVFEVELKVQYIKSEHNYFLLKEISFNFSAKYYSLLMAIILGNICS